MPQFGVSITKQASWRGLTVEWSNRYHYLGNIDILTESQFLQIIDAVFDAERPAHAADVKFVSGRLWGPTGVGKEASLMRATRSWSNIAGTAAAPTQPMYRECAFLYQWPLGRYGSKNRPQYLRKWLHTFTNFILGANEVAGTAQISSVPSPLQNYRNAVDDLVVTGVTGSPFQLCTEQGRQPLGPGTLYGYLEHRQFGR